MRKILIDLSGGTNMSLSKKLRLLAVVGVFIVASAIFSVPASATESSESIDDLVSSLIELNPGASEQELIAAASRYAAETNSTLDVVLAEALAEAEASIQAATAGSAEYVQSNSVPKLGYSARKGDIFVSPGYTLFIDHGHTGIYFNTYTIVEAPGAGQNSRSFPAVSKSVEYGTVKQYVTTTQANCDAAANYAYNNMRFKPYNYFFAFNKNVPAASYNCSQLVWGAYKITTGIDLDSDGGPGVYPYDIKNSNRTVSYETI